jgi:hypothetical protein
MVIDIAGHQEEIGLLRQTKLDKRIKSAEDGLPEPTADLAGTQAQPSERRIQMQVGGMDKAKGLHGSILYEL